MAPALVLVVGLLVASVGCASGIWIASTGVTEYQAVKVRVYYGALRCRVEVVTPTETIQTSPTNCTRVPHRVPAP